MDKNGNEYHDGERDKRTFEVGRWLQGMISIWKGSRKKRK